MYYYPQKTYYGASEKWLITYREHYKLLTDKDYNVKYLIRKYGTETPEDANNDQNLVPFVTLKQVIVIT